MIPLEWDEYFISLLPMIAIKSKDESTKNSAIIVGEDHEILSTGYNSFPRGLNDYVKERQERPLKYMFFEHAERNAINNAALHGIKIKNSTMYISAFPCSGCARGIINSGIKRIVVYKKFAMKLMQYNEWDEDSIISKEMLEEVGVKIDWYEKELKCQTKFICRGEEIE